MTKQEILEYAVDTPTNTNKAVLSGMLDKFASGDNKTEIALTATENQVYTPEEGKVYNKVTVNVPPTPLDTITLTENGTTNAQEGRGFKTINVNVPAPPSDYSTAQVTLTYEGGGLVNDYIGLPTIENNVMHIAVVESDGTYTVPLYKGSIVIASNGRTPTIISGDAEISGNDIIVTGDCSFSIYLG